MRLSDVHVRGLCIGAATALAGRGALAWTHKNPNHPLRHLPLSRRPLLVIDGPLAHRHRWQHLPLHQFSCPSDILPVTALASTLIAPEQKEHTASTNTCTRPLLDQDSSVSDDCSTVAKNHKQQQQQQEHDRVRAILLDKENPTIIKLLNSAQASTTTVCVEELTRIFLDSTKNPPGSLSWDVLDSAFSLLSAWTNTGTTMGAQVAHCIFQRLVAEEDATTNDYWVVTEKHVGMVINGYCRADRPHDALKVLSELEDMDFILATRPRNRIMINSVMSAFARHGHVDQCKELLQQIDSPTVMDYNVVLAARAKCGQARQAEDLLRSMLVKSSSSSQHDEVQPDVVSYNCVLDAWRNSDQEGASDRALSILSILSSNADAKSYSCVALLLIKEGRTGRALELLSEAQAQGIEMDGHLQNTILMARAMVVHGITHHHHAQDAQECLEEMERDGIANTVSYNIVLNAWAKSGAHDMAERAHAILNRMVENGLDDAVSYSSVIECYTKSKHEESATRAEELLDQMIHRTHVLPNTVTINNVLNALAKTGEASRADSLLTRIEQKESNGSPLDGVQLDTISYTSVIDAYSKSGLKGSAQKAEEVFQRMEDAYERGNVDAKPNSRSFNTAINAWVQSGEPQSAERADDMLTKMEDSYKADNDSIAPTVVSYSIVMNGWSKSNSPKKLTRIANVFQRMRNMYNAGNEDCQPNFVSFVTLIDAIIKSGERGAAHRAQDVLFRMYQEFQEGNADVKPNARLITTVMDGYCQSGIRNAGEKAEALLDWMLEVYAEEEDLRYRPNEISFNRAINAWSKSRVFGKGHRAKMVLQKMIDLYEAGASPAKPNAFVFTSVINACAHAIGDEAEKADALKIATATFHELCSSDYGDPNHVTYVAYLTALRNLMPKDDATRSTAIRTVFEKCCGEGQVNDLILRRLEKTLTSTELRDLYRSAGVDASHGVGVSQLPVEWKRNVVERQPKRKRKQKGELKGKPISYSGSRNCDAESTSEGQVV